MTTEQQNYRYKYPNESFSGCDMVATIVYGWKEKKDEFVNKDNPTEKATATDKWGSRTLGEIQTISYSIHMEKRPVRSIGNVNAKDYVMGPRTIAGSLVFAVFNKHFAESIIKDNNDWYTEGKAFLVDELPPFNIVISMANEYGLRSKMVIYGVRLLNEGQVMSVNDVFTENTYQFVATDIEYLNDEVTYTTRTKDFNKFLFVSDHYSTKDPEMRPADTEFFTEDNPMETITLSVLTSFANSKTKIGRANFSLTPNQNEGIITITDSSGKEENKKIIQVNGSNSYSIDLKPDVYRAKFSKESTSRWRSSSVTFRIKEYEDKYDKKKYAPIIEVIADTYFKIYSNESSHSHVKLVKEEDSSVSYFELKNRRATLDNLTSDTKYIISTCTGPDTLESPSIKVSTFTVFEKPFNDFKKMVDTNRQLLIYNEVERYYKVIEEAKKIAATSSNYDSPTNCIIAYKTKLENELKTLDKSSDDYLERYNELITFIYAANELVYLSNRVHNNIMITANKNTEVPIPSMFHDDNYDTVFTFNKDITKSEFYKVIKTASQCVESVSSDRFESIESVENSYKFKGKSGSNHYVQALIDGARSPKLEFYEMTTKEKLQAIESSAENGISQDAQTKIAMTVKDELEDQTVFDRAFMHRLKSLSAPLLLDVEVISIEEDSITVSTIVNKLLDNDQDFYIVVAKKEDITNNDFLYKCKFTSQEKEIILKDMDYAIHPNKEYALWIEDDMFNQISNVTTFSMSKEDTNDRAMFEYETKNIIKGLKSSLKSELPSSIYESLISHIEYNEGITKINIIEEAIWFLLYSGLSEKAIIASLKAIKYYIGTLSYCDDILSNISYKDRILELHSSKDLCTTAMAFNEGNVEYFNSNDKIDIANIKADYVIVMSFTNDLKYKGNVIYINKATNKMEVL